MRPAGISCLRREKLPDDVADYVVCHSPTVNIFLGVRLIDADPESAKQALES